MTPPLPPWDAVMKEVLLRLFGQAGAAVTTEYTVVVISAGFPRKVLRQSPQLVRFRQVRKALWQAEMELPLYVLVCSELEVTPRNYPFLLFATGKKRREFLRALVQEAGSPYLPLALELYPQAVTEELLMSRRGAKREEEFRKALDLIGPERVIRWLTPEVLLEAIQSQGPEQRAQLVELDFDSDSPNRAIPNPQTRIITGFYFSPVQKQ